MNEIIQEKIRADHLLFVSLKYTRTIDVILNLMDRWRTMIEKSVDKLLEKAKKKKLIKKIPIAPRMKTEILKDIFKKEPIVIKTIEFYEFLKRVDGMQKVRENEFRRNVTLKLLDKNQWVSIDLDKLKDLHNDLEEYLEFVKKFLAS